MKVLKLTLYSESFNQDGPLTVLINVEEIAAIVQTSYLNRSEIILRCGKQIKVDQSPDKILQALAEGC